MSAENIEVLSVMTVAQALAIAAAHSEDESWDFWTEIENLNR